MIRNIIAVAFVLTGVIIAIVPVPATKEEEQIETIQIKVDRLKNDNNEIKKYMELKEELKKLEEENKQLKGAVKHE